MDALTLPLTHIAAVFYIARSYRVVATYPRGTADLAKKHPGCSWMFVPATVKATDEVLLDEGVTVYADPEWAERYANETE
jgi:hypothetical protein